MKKFKFSLDTILNYKNLILEELKREHGIIAASVTKQKNKIRDMEREYTIINDRFNERKEQGMSAVEAMSYKIHMDAMQVNIKLEQLKLEQLKKEENAKQTEVISAKVESSSFDKLKEKYIEEYNKTVQKEDEIFIEEFISTRGGMENV